MAEKVVEGVRRLAKEGACGAEGLRKRQAALILRTFSFQEKRDENLWNGDLELNQCQCSPIRHDGKNEQNGHGGGNWHRGGGDHWYRKVDSC